VVNTFPNQNQPPDLDLIRVFTHFFPFPQIKVESSKIAGSKPINGLIPENYEHKNGDFTRDQNFLSGLSPSYLSLLAYTPCEYVPTCLLLNASGEISPTPGLERNI